MNRAAAAMEAIREATAGPDLDRAAVLRWRRIADSATGTEREELQGLSEALIAAAVGDDRRWLRSALSGAPAAPGRLDALEARIQRLDARIKAAPGQLDLFGGGGPGTGKPCGESHIAAFLECHKGPGAPGPAAAKPGAPPVAMSLDWRAVKPAWSPKAEEQSLIHEVPVLTVEGKEALLLGSGSYGHTFRATINGKPAVVKVQNLKAADLSDWQMASGRAHLGRIEGVAEADYRARQQQAAEWEQSNLALAAGVGAAPKPIGGAFRVKSGASGELHGFAYELGDGTPLAESATERGLARPTLNIVRDKVLASEAYRKELAMGTAQKIRALADAGLVHEDLHAGNILLDTKKGARRGAKDSVRFIDWGGAYRMGSGSPAERLVGEIRMAAAMYRYGMLGRPFKDRNGGLVDFQEQLGREDGGLTLMLNAAGMAYSKEAIIRAGLEDDHLLVTGEKARLPTSKYSLELKARLRGASAEFSEEDLAEARRRLDRVIELGIREDYGHGP